MILLAISVNATFIYSKFENILEISFPFDHFKVNRYTTFFFFLQFLQRKATLVTSCLLSRVQLFKASLA